MGVGHSDPFLLAPCLFHMEQIGTSYLGTRRWGRKDKTDRVPRLGVGLVGGR